MNTQTYLRALCKLLLVTMLFVDHFAFAQSTYEQSAKQFADYPSIARGVLHNPLSTIYKLTDLSIHLDPEHTRLLQTESVQGMSSSKWMMPFGVLWGSVGYDIYSGKSTETMSSGLRLSIIELSSALIRDQNWLWFGIAPIDIGYNEYNETGAEKEALKYYSVVTKEYGTVTDIHPLENVACLRYLLSVDTRILPFPSGLAAGRAGKRIFPFARLGYSYHYITLFQKVGGSSSGSNPFVAVGLNWTTGDPEQESAPSYILFEVICAPVPDWNARLLPELRPINGGQSLLLRIGYGVLREKGMD